MGGDGRDSDRMSRAARRAEGAWKTALARAVDTVWAWTVAGRRDEIKESAATAKLAGMLVPANDMNVNLADNLAAAYGAHSAWERRARAGRQAAKTMRELEAAARLAAREEGRPNAGDSYRTAALEAAARASSEAAEAWERAAALAARAAAIEAGAPAK